MFACKRDKTFCVLKGTLVVIDFSEMESAKHIDTRKSQKEGKYKVGQATHIGAPELIRAKALALLNRCDPPERMLYDPVGVSRMEFDVAMTVAMTLSVASVLKRGVLSAFAFSSCPHPHPMIAPRVDHARRP
jgi:hypothetical protein